MKPSRQKTQTNPLPQNATSTSRSGSSGAAVSFIFRILAGCNSAQNSRKAWALKALFFATSLLLLLIPVSAHAQTPVAIEGLQVIAERQYATDSDAPFDTSTDDVFLASARVYLFDDEVQAESTWETLTAADVVAQQIPEDNESISYETTELEGVGDRAVVINLNAELEEATGVFRTVIIQNGTAIITVTVIAGSQDSAAIADDIAMAMSERDAGEDEAIYDGTGKSTGGVWEIFLPADSDVLGDLKPYADKETRPAV